MKNEEGLIEPTSSFFIYHFLTGSLLFLDKVGVSVLPVNFFPSVAGVFTSHLIVH